MQTLIALAPLFVALAPILKPLFEAFFANWSAQANAPVTSEISRTDADDDDPERRLLDRIHRVWP